MFNGGEARLEMIESEDDPLAGVQGQIDVLKQAQVAETHRKVF